MFLDCAAGIAVNSTGHSHPDVVKAIADQAGRFLHMSGTDFYYEPQVRLAEEIAAIVPIEGGVKSFFGNSGTEAIEAAHQAGAVRDRPPEHHRVSRRLSRPDDGRAGADGEQAGAAPRLRAADARRVSRAVRRLLSLPGRAEAGDVRGRMPRLHRAPALRASRFARRSRRRSSSSRFRAKAATSSRPISSCSGCASSRGRTGSCSLSTKCSRAWDAPARCSRSSTPACSPTSSRSRKASPRACRSASPPRAPTS